MSNKNNNNNNNDNNDNKTICLYIQPYVHINIKNNDILLYNTLNGQQLVFNNHPALAALLHDMMSPKNQNAVIKSHAILEEESLSQFFHTAKTNGLINWYLYSKENGDLKKPVAMPPLLNFHRDRGKMAIDPQRNRGQDIIKYLYKLNIYINCFPGDHSGGTLFTEGRKQFLFPCTEEEYRELELAAVRQLIEPVKDLGRCSVSILGGNIFQYKELDNLIDYLALLPLKREIGIFYKHITAENLQRIDWEKLKGSKENANENPKEISLRIFIEPQIEKSAIVNCFELLKQLPIESSYQFTIQSEADADKLEEYINLAGDSQFYVKPFYDGKNYEFFKDNIFIEKSDLSEPVVSKKDIYTRSVMNPAAFGEMTVLSSGRIHSNLYEEPIGVIGQDIKQVLLNELYNGTGWFQLRKNIEPCRDCLYHQLCPPVSNYEYALSRNNLCRMYG